VDTVPLPDCDSTGDVYADADAVRANTNANTDANRTHNNSNNNSNTNSNRNADGDAVSGRYTACAGTDCTDYRDQRRRAQLD